MTVKRVRAPHEPDSQRLFIALWPPPELAQRLAQVSAMLQAACGGRPVPLSNQHITLAFLGGVPAVRIAQVQRMLRSAAAEAFTLQIDKLSYRRRGGMVWARAARVPAALDALVQGLRSALAALGFVLEDRAFVPHITLLRDARKPASLPELALPDWHVNALTLVRSHLDNHGARYEVVFRVPLAGQG